MSWLYLCYTPFIDCEKGVSRREKFVAFREEEQIIKLLDQVAADKGIDRSDFIREAVRKSLAELSFFSVEQKKALGLPTQPPQSN